MWIFNVLLAGMGLSVFSAMAVDVTINITGKVVAAPCTVSNATRDIELPDIEATALANPGSFSPWQVFTLSLTNCPASTTSVVATFSGTPASEDATLYKNTGDAQHVAVQLKESRPGGDGYIVGPGAKSHSFNVDSSRNASLELAARSYSVNGGAMPGSINAVSTVTLTYQ